MTNTVEISEIYSAIEQSAQLLNLPLESDKVKAALAAFEPAFTDASVALRIATGARREKLLGYRYIKYTGDLDPLETALAAGMVERGDHPAERLFWDVKKQFPIEGTGGDFEIAAGFQKIWCFFPSSRPQPLDELSKLDSMPRAVADNLDVLARYGLHAASLFAVDYTSHTLNIYFDGLPAGTFAPERVRELMRELGIPEPTEDELDLCAKAFAVYFTFSWDSSKIDRVCFPVLVPEPELVPTTLGPTITRLAQRVPFAGTDRKCIYATTLSARGTYYKLEPFYHWKPEIVNAMHLADPPEEHSA
ncbi:aromatic prenyltransferase [Streptomyces sp. NPDC058000]|uniref:aromatic prenyltransferase n=1 Tax=Streptomyces sp. NPDC058000 TaxID=3346299 RepID=UPI0036EAD9FE